MIKNFLYNDIVLYCKGWYETPEGDTMLDDLGYLFSKIYAWTPKTESEIANFMIQVVDTLYTKMNVKWGNGQSTYTFLFVQVHRYMSLYDCSFDRAIILWVRCILQGLSKDIIKLNPPKYGKKEHFRMGTLFGDTPISMTYTEMNCRAKKVFSNYEKD